MSTGARQPISSRRCAAPARILLGSLAVAFGVLGPACAALAQPTLVTDAYQLASREPLALAGSATLVAGYGGRNDVVRSFAPGHSPVVIARVHPDGEGHGEIALSGSPSRIALLHEGVLSSGYKDCCASFYHQVASGPLGGPLEEPTTGCQIAPGLDESVQSEAGIPPHSAVALDGQVLAYDSFGCVVVRDYASGLQRIVPLEATLDPVYDGAVQIGLHSDAVLRVAGRLIAYRANQFGGEGPASVVVYDIDTGEELYRVPLPPYNPYESLVTFGLEANGTLVLADEANCSATMSTISHPSPVPLGIAACAIYGARAGRALIVVPGPRSHQTLAWTPLQAPVAHPIADLGVDGEIGFLAAPVFDETSVVYAVSGCWTPSVYRAPLAEPGTPPAPAAFCPVIVSPGYATLTARALRVRLRCPLGCEGSLCAHAGKANELRGEESGMNLTVDCPSIFIAPGQAVVTTLLPAQQEDEGDPALHRLARTLRRKRRLDLRLDFTVNTPSFEGERTLEGIVSKTHRHVIIPIRP